MQSSTNSASEAPYRIVDIRVEESGRIYTEAPPDLYVRFRALHYREAPSRDFLKPQIEVAAEIEASHRTWAQPDRIGSTFVTHRVYALVDIAADLADPPTWPEVVAFTAKELNAVLENLVTLYGIAHNVTIHVEHKLRAAPSGLSHLVAPLRPKQYRK